MPSTFDKAATFAKATAAKTADKTVGRRKTRKNVSFLCGSPRRFALPPSDQTDAPCEAGRANRLGEPQCVSRISDAKKLLLRLFPAFGWRLAFKDADGSILGDGVPEEVASIHCDVDTRRKHLGKG